MGWLDTARWRKTKCTSPKNFDPAMMRTFVRSQSSTSDTPRTTPTTPTTPNLARVGWFLSRDQDAAKGKAKAPTPKAQLPVPLKAVLQRMQRKEVPRLELVPKDPALVAVPVPRTPVGWVHNFCQEVLGGGLVTVTFNGVLVPTFRQGGLIPSPFARETVYRTLVPTTPLHRTGEHRFDVVLHDGRHLPATVPVPVSARTFAVERLWLNQEKGGLSLDEFEHNRVGAATRSRIGRQLWKGAFKRPCAGEVSTPYGVRRYYNGRWAENYYHRGVDYAASEGEPVVAPANGTVSFVGYEDKGFNIHGNCVGVDHGQGVVSLMMHLKSVHVKPGDYIRMGNKLGEVGNTGLSTGPHLHWGLYVGGHAIDPTPWMERRATSAGANGGSHGLDQLVWGRQDD